MDRNPILDGWRGIAIGLVLFAHLCAGVSGRLGMLGAHGVQVFFVLSGYLITSKLIAQPIDLRRFYVRRIFRLWPVAWLYLAVVVFFLVIVRKPFAIEVTACLVFFRNYLSSSSSFAFGLTGHFWSLSIEEQFYLFWPAVLLMTGRRALWFALAGFAVDAAYVLWRWEGGWTLVRTEYNMHSLLIGCAMALAWQKVDGTLFRYRWILPISAVGIALHAVLNLPLMLPTESFLIALAIGSSIVVAPRLLSWKPLTWLGLISYSIYVWQELFMVTVSSAWLRTGLAISVGAASYYWVERPGKAFASRWLSEAGETVQGSGSSAFVHEEAGS